MATERYTEKRVDPRLDILDYAMIEQQDADPLRSVIVDIALGGVQVRTREKLPVGSVCHLCMGSISPDMIRIRGEVRHSKKCNASGLFATGIRFLPETHEERSTIAEYLQVAFQRRADFLL